VTLPPAFNDQHRAAPTSRSVQHHGIRHAGVKRAPRRAVDVCRASAIDAVEAAGSGQPGNSVALAPTPYLLLQRMLRHRRSGRWSSPLTTPSTG
jgi:hypothetical protein